MIELINGDCLEEMKKIPDGSIDLVLTDPPYGLEFMGKDWDKGVPGVHFWVEMLRVLKPGGYLLSFGGTRTYHRMASAIEDGGFEVRDMIEWVYGSGFPKSLNIGKAVDKLGENPFGWLDFADTYKKIIEESKYNHNDIDKHLGIKASSCYWARKDHRGGLPPRHHWKKIKEFIGLDNRYDELYDEVEREVLGQKEVMGKDNNLIYGKYKGGIVDITKGTSEWEGWGTALKPAHEPICMARKPLAEKTVASNVLKYGTGGINIDESRVGTETISIHNAPKGTFAGGEPDRGSDTESYRESVGRFPANLIHDNSEEVRECFPDSKSPAKRQTNSWFPSGEANGVDGEAEGYGDSGNAARFFKSIIYQAKASKSERNKGCEELNARGIGAKGNGLGRVCETCGASQLKPEECFCEVKSWINPAKNGNHHPTVKPIAIMEYLTNMCSKEGAVVLDPFMGSGTTGVACKNLNRNFIGIELDKEYFEIAKKRINEI